MLVYYKLASDERFPRIIGEGVMSIEEVIDSFTSALADPSFARGVGTIIDIRDSQSERTHEEIRQIAKLLGEQRGKTGDRLAVVVSDALHYGLGRMFAAYAEFRDLSVEVFTNLEDANHWLEAKTAPRPHSDTSPIFSRVPAPQFSKGASQRKESNDGIEPM